MKGDIVPDTHHITRLCGGSHVREDGTIAATAFKLRPDESYLSVNWLEILALPNRDMELAEVRRVLGTKRKIGRASRLVIINVGYVRSVVRRESNAHTELTILHEPELDPLGPHDASHSGIYGVPEDDIAIPELIAAATLDVVLAH